MARRRNTATKNEYRFALAFVKALHGDTSNPYLLTAVIAWLRQESGSLSRVIGNNPFNIRRSPFAYGYRKSSRPHGGHFALFRTLEIGAKATVYLLTSAGHDWRHYDRIVRAARGSNNGTPKDQQRQALDFLAAIAMSAWDAGHYGAKDGDPRKNHLVMVWTSITGLPPLPAEPNKPRHAQPRHQPKPPPRDLKAPMQMVTFIDPYEARGFYNARHGKDEPLTGGL